MGSRFAGISRPTWVERFDAVCVTVDYRLAPEHPDPGPVEDRYATLVWTVQHAAELGIDPERLVVTGPSAGGGLAAGVALLARDRGGPALLGQMLVSPMLDDRNETVSAHQIDGVGVWDRGSNDMGWNALLGDRRGTDAVSVYAAPARATDLAGLPPRSSSAAVPRCSGTRTSRMPRRSGPPGARPSCTCGRVGSTRPTSWHRTRASPRRVRRPATPGWRASSARDPLLTARSTRSCPHRSVRSAPMWAAAWVLTVEGGSATFEGRERYSR